MKKQLLIILISTFMVIGCDSFEMSHDVDYYLSHNMERIEKTVYCNSNPEYQSETNCRNAREAAGLIELNLLMPR